jgi:hypothetical protein
LRCWLCAEFSRRPRAAGGADGIFLVNRRDFIGLFGAAVTARPVTLLAQQEAKIWRIGFLTPIPLELAVSADRVIE